MHAPRQVSSAAGTPHGVPPVRVDYRDGLPVLVLDDRTEFEALRDAVVLQAQAAELCGSLRLDLGQRVPDRLELRRLSAAIRDETLAVVAGVYSCAEAMHRFAERELAVRIQLSDGRAQFDRDPVECATQELVTAAQTVDVFASDGGGADSGAASRSAAERADASVCAALAEDELGSAPGACVDEAPDCGDAETGAGDAESALQSLNDGPPAGDDDVALGPVDGDPVDGDPVDGDPVEGDPVDGDPVEGDPVEGDPDDGDDLVASGEGEDEPVAPSAEPTAPTSPFGGRQVLAVDRTLRSGASVRYAGDVIVYGDVNAGAEVEADGSVLVLGRLRGVAHAGARGDNKAVILAFDLRPTQIRIGGCIACTPNRAPAPRKGVLALLHREKERPAAPRFTPEIAHIVDGRIVLEDYSGRLPS